MSVATAFMKEGVIGFATAPIVNVCERSQGTLCGVFRDSEQMRDEPDYG